MLIVGRGVGGGANLKTLSLNHFNGSDGATSFTDDVSGIIWKQYDLVTTTNSELDTAIKQFGSASLLCNAGANPSGAICYDFSSPHAGNWTIEAFIHTPEDNIEIGLLNSAGNIAVEFLVYQSSSPQLELILYNSSGTPFIDATAVQTVTANTQYHIAAVREGTSYSAYFNGTRFYTGTDATNVRSATRGFILGFNASQHVDEFRISNEARYSGASLTVPSGEFTAD